MQVNGWHDNVRKKLRESSAGGLQRHPHDHSGCIICSSPVSGSVIVFIRFAGQQHSAAHVRCQSTRKAGAEIVKSFD